jgi:hypothetical protein
MNSMMNVSPAIDAKRPKQENKWKGYCRAVIEVCNLMQVMIIIMMNQMMVKWKELTIKVGNQDILTIKFYWI